MSCGGSDKSVDQICKIITKEKEIKTKKQHQKQVVIAGKSDKQIVAYNGKSFRVKLKSN